MVRENVFLLDLINAIVMFQTLSVILLIYYVSSFAFEVVHEMQED